MRCYCCRLPEMRGTEPGDCSIGCGIGQGRAWVDRMSGDESNFVQFFDKRDGQTDITPHLHVVARISSSRTAVNERNFATSLLCRLHRRWYVKSEVVKCMHCLERYLGQGNGRVELYKRGDRLNDDPPSCEACFVRALSGKSRIGNGNIGDRLELSEGQTSTDTRGDQELTVAATSSSINENAPVQSDNGQVEIVGADGEFCEQRLHSRADWIRSKRRAENDEGLPVTVAKKSKRPDVPELETTCRTIEHLSIVNGAFMESDINSVVLGDQRCRYLAMSPRWGSLLQQMGVRIRSKIRETPFKERCQMAWTHYRDHPDYLTAEDSAKSIISILMLNNIDWRTFVRNVYLHATSQTGKKNCFCIIGRPSSGKSALLESIIKCHWNYVRLNSFSRYNNFCWAELIGANAGYMDEIHVDGMQFETWKLIAAGQDVSVDVKYKGKGTIRRTPLYVASNGEIHQYAVECIDRVLATETRCYRYDFMHDIPVKTDKLINPCAWKLLWDMMSKGREANSGTDIFTRDKPYIQKDAECIVTAFITE